jgi:hypothetical protein
MLIEATIIIVLLLLLAYKLWESNSGAFSEMSSLARAMQEMNEDIFRGETRSLRCLVNGEERFLDVKTVMDAMQAMDEHLAAEEEYGTTTMFLDPAGENEVRLESTTKKEKRADGRLGDATTFRLVKGEETIQELTFIDAGEPMEVVRFFQTVFGDMRTGGGVWDLEEEP